MSPHGASDGSVNSQFLFGAKFQKLPRQTSWLVVKDSGFMERNSRNSRDGSFQRDEEKSRKGGGDPLGKT